MTQSWFQVFKKQFAQVNSWLPSRRPKYKDTRTGIIYTLDKVDGYTIWLRKACGRSLAVTSTTFEKYFKKI